MDSLSSSWCKEHQVLLPILLRGISSHINGGGGGRPTFAQGGGSNPDGLPEALDAARSLIGV